MECCIETGRYIGPAYSFRGKSRHEFFHVHEVARKRREGEDSYILTWFSHDFHEDEERVAADSSYHLVGEGGAG